MVRSNVKRLCLYCGEPTSRGCKGEHVVPEVIGGSFTLNDVVPNRPVCRTCNSGVLSQLDKELCSRSYLSVIASREIGAHLWQVWDVDHDANNLLMEARPKWAADESLNSLVCYPQIIFEQSGAEVRGDSEEFLRFGREDASKVLFRAVRRCFDKYRAGEKGVLHFERVRSLAVRDEYRLAPRIFTPHSIDEVANNIRNQSFILRFSSAEDKRFALYSLSKLGDASRLRNWGRMRGSYYPMVSTFFDLDSTMRALMKLGLNLIAAFCPNTPVNHESFKSAVRMILGKAGQIPPEIVMSNGFVHAEDIQTINASDNAHSFRLVHIEDMWHVFSSFFGGNVGSYVRVPGPNHENWRCADITAPLRSKNWKVRTSPLIPYMKVRVEWNNGRVVIPSFKLHNAQSSLRGYFTRKRPLPH